MRDSFDDAGDAIAALNRRAKEVFEQGYARIRAKGTEDPENKFFKVLFEQLPYVIAVISDAHGIGTDEILDDIFESAKIQTLAQAHDLPRERAVADEFYDIMNRFGGDGDVPAKPILPIDRGKIEVQQSKLMKLMEGTAQAKEPIDLLARDRSFRQLVGAEPEDMPQKVMDRLQSPLAKSLRDIIVRAYPDAMSNINHTALKPEFFDGVVHAVKVKLCTGPHFIAAITALDLDSSDPAL